MEYFCLEKIDWYKLSFGYAYTNILGSYIIWKVMKKMQQMTNDRAKKKHRWQPLVTGIVERTLYMISFLVERPEFIIAWLAYKVAVGWKNGDEYGRLKFSNQFNGSALSVLYTFFGYVIVLYGDFKAYILGLFPIVLSLLIIFILRRYEKYITDA